MKQIPVLVTHLLVINEMIVFFCVIYDFGEKMSSSSTNIESGAFQGGAH